MPFTIAIVGRPNVGKSALFNRIAGKRIAIVHDRPGVTRDRVTAEAQWKGHSFTLIDTGGIGLRDNEVSMDLITQAAMDQVEIAIDSADLILFVVSVKDGLLPLDEEVARKLRVSGKPVLLTVNKVDHAGLAGQVDDFSSLGFDHAHPVSAAHDRGTEALLDEVLSRMEKKPESRTGSEPQPAGSQDRDPLKLAIVGRPNVGKSSLINSLTRSSRVIVNEMAGTTRDSVDVPFEFITGKVRESFILIDTAGIRKQTRVKDSIEFYSVKRAEDSISRCDLAVLVIDAESGVTEQDKKIAGKITLEKKACVIVINKWDLVEEEVRRARNELKGQIHSKLPTTLNQFGEWVQEQLFFISYAPVVFTSAKSGFHLDKLIETVQYVFSQIKTRIPTSLLNRVLRDAMDKKAPLNKNGQPLKFFYATQLDKVPPTFLLFLNRDGVLDDHYGRFLQGMMRKSFGFEGCPMGLISKPRPKKVEGIRKFKPKRALPTQKSSPGPRKKAIRQPARKKKTTRPKNVL